MKTPLIPDTLVTDRVAAAALSVSRAHIWGHFVKSGKLPAVKLSARVTRFRSNDILNLIQPAKDAA